VVALNQKDQELLPLPTLSLWLSLWLTQELVVGWELASQRPSSQPPSLQPVLLLLATTQKLLPSPQVQLPPQKQMLRVPR
jgi:hypothetical protein